MLNKMDTDFLIQCIYKTTSNLYSNCVFGATCTEKRSVIIGVIIDKIFIIIYHIIGIVKYKFFHVFCLPKCLINMLL